VSLAPHAIIVPYELKPVSGVGVLSHLAVAIAAALVVVPNKVLLKLVVVKPSILLVGVRRSTIKPVLPVMELTVAALPDSAAVMVPAEKLPDPSLATIVEAVLAEVALEVTV
jgi:hypothetical protein